MILNSYGIYKGSRNASWQCLLDYHIDRLPVTVSQIIRSAGIRLLDNSEVEILPLHQSGQSLSRKGLWTIIIDDKDTPQRQRFTMAHELGHIFLGHGETGSYTAEEETAANVFASRLLAPACVLWALDIHDAQDIQKLCDISLTAATIRAERMQVLYERNKFLASSLEQQVYRQFLPFIQSFKKSK